MPNPISRTFDQPARPSTGPDRQGAICNRSRNSSMGGRSLWAKLTTHFFFTPPTCRYPLWSTLFSSFSSGLRPTLTAWRRANPASVEIAKAFFWKPFGGKFERLRRRSRHGREPPPQRLSHKKTIQAKLITLKLLSSIPGSLGNRFD